VCASVCPWTSAKRNSMSSKAPAARSRAPIGTWRRKPRGPFSAISAWMRRTRSRRLRKRFKAIGAREHNWHEAARTATTDSESAHFSAIAPDYHRDPALCACHRGCMRSDSVPVVLRAWIECPVCGRTDRFTKEIRLDADAADPLTIQAPFICQRCGTRRASLMLERRLRVIH
jgi:hypothetical protein